MVIDEFKRLRGSWNEMGQKTQAKHLPLYIDETPKRSNTKRLVSKPPCSTVVDTVNIDICVKVFIYKTITRFIYM